MKLLRNMPVGVRKFRNERLLFPVLFKPSQKHSKKRSVLTKLEFNFGFWWSFDVSLSALPGKVVEIALELALEQ